MKTAVYANYKPTDTLSASGFYTGILLVIDVVWGGVECEGRIKPCHSTERTGRTYQI